MLDKDYQLIRLPNINKIKKKDEKEFRVKQAITPRQSTMGVGNPIRPYGCLGHQ